MTDSQWFQSAMSAGDPPDLDAVAETAQGDFCVIGCPLVKYRPMPPVFEGEGVGIQSTEQDGSFEE